MITGFHRIDFALFFQKFSGFLHVFGKTAAQDGRLFSQIGIAIAREQQGHVLRLRACQLGNFADIVSIGGIALRVLIVSIDLFACDLGKLFQEFRVFLGKILAHNPQIVSWCAPFAHFLAAHQHLTRLLGLAQRWLPHIRGIYVATLPCSGDFWWAQIDNIDFFGINIPVFQGR